jgi:hypothetical protein
VTEQPPWRAGIAFDEAGREDAALWFDRLVAAHPDLAGYRRVPQRLAVDQTVYLGPPPRFLVDFTADEAVLLRAIASGARIDELRARLRDRWEAAQRALFSLMARQAVTLQRGQSVHPESWKKILTDLEASLAIDSLGAAGIAAPIEPPPAAVEAKAPARAATPLAPEPSGPVAPADRAAGIELASDDGAPLELAEPFAAPPEEAPAPTAAASPNIDRSGAGLGWRRKPKRSADAQVAFDRGLSEIAAGNVTGGITFLRIALTLSPGDPEIAHHLGKVAFKPR